LPKQRSDQLGRIGNFWLSRRPNSGQWCRTWFDPGTRQTRRASLGTENLEQAKFVLAEWVTRNVALRREQPRDVPIAVVFARYYEKHAQSAIGADIQRGNLRTMLGVLPEGITVAELNLEAQRAAVTALSRRYAPATVKRIFGATKAAVTWAWKNGELDRPIPFASLPDGPNRERALSVKELARLWDTEMSEHVRMFLVLLLATSGRPQAVLQLTRFQCDLDRGTINLNPPAAGRPPPRRAGGGTPPGCPWWSPGSGSAG
jgi:integrase